VPTSGSLFQLSQVYSTYGYEPKAGKAINLGNVTVSGSNNRVYYARPSPDSEGTKYWSTFTYTAINALTGEESFPATVTLVPLSGTLMTSTFLLSNENWTISGNKFSSSFASFEPYSRDFMLNHYIFAADDKISVDNAGDSDRSLWYFSAPTKYLGNFGISYGGNLEFILGSFSGDFSRKNNADSSLVELECMDCAGPVGPGIKLIYPIKASAAALNFVGKTTKFSVPLLESSGWLKDPQNVLLKWSAPSVCDMIQVLSRLSSIKILGDWTVWYESIALDEVRLVNTEAKLPVCSMIRPDASICNC